MFQVMGAPVDNWPSGIVFFVGMGVMPAVVANPADRPPLGGAAADGRQHLRLGGVRLAAFSAAESRSVSSSWL